MNEDQYLGNLYQRFPVTVEKALGSHVWDTDNNEYIDCMGGYGVALVGHRNERVVNAIKSQIEKLSLSESRIFISGPTGSGKELIARTIYKKSKSRGSSKKH